MLKVTPDPGVIEVNIQPATSWREAVDITRGIYQDARAARLGTEKFMLDGKHTGTGGGNHVVLGGATPADSPFLRRPDLLKSLVLYSHDRPSLSYLFSGLFIGPTSQAPRIDEARQDQLYELEIACQQSARGRRRDRCRRGWSTACSAIFWSMSPATPIAPKSASTSCISPDGPTGRLGLVEFRSFEMPPDARMSLAQQLLLRALIAWFWRDRSKASSCAGARRCTTASCCEHFVWSDFLEVLDDLSDAGYTFDPGWFEAQRQFRFALCGTVAARRRRARTAPGHRAVVRARRRRRARRHGALCRFLGRAAAGQGFGIDTDRHAVTCNGRRVPLTSTGRSGEYVAGVRFKAWNLAHRLQPTIGVQAPLTFDIVDTWNRRSLGGCVYHVAHPGGRNYETFPVNPTRRKARRRARFQDHGYTGGTIDVPPLDLSLEYPLTLDLRRS